MDLPLLAEMDTAVVIGMTVVVCALVAALAGYFHAVRRLRTVEQSLAKESELAELSQKELSHELKTADEQADEDRNLMVRVAGAMREMWSVSDRRELAETLSRTVERLFQPSQWMIFLASEQGGADFVLAAVGAGEGTDERELWPQGARLSTDMGRLSLVAERAVVMDRTDFGAEPPIVRGNMDRTEPAGFQVDVAAPVVLGQKVEAIVSVGGPQTSLESARAAMELLARSAASVVRGLNARDRLLKWENCDEETGLYNKSYFTAQGAELVYENRAAGQHSAVAIFGIDDFSGYVERNGQAAAERLLKSIAEVVSPLFRQGDLLARWSNEEFAAVLSGLDVELAGAVIDRLRKSVSRIDWPGGKSQPGGRLTLCAGVAVSTENHETLEQLIDVASSTAAIARFGGGDRVRVAEAGDVSHTLAD